MASQTVSSRNADISFTSHGTSAARLVAVSHGDENALASISESFISFDLRGFGGSKIKADAAATMQLSDYVSDLDAVVGKASGKPVALFGYSHGGYFVTAYALAHPEKVAGLILVEPALFTPTEDLLRRAKQAGQGDGAGALNTTLRFVAPQVGLKSEQQHTQAILAYSQGPETLAAEFRVRAENPIREEDLHTIEVPVLVIGGTRSAVRHMATKTAAAIPHSSLWWIRGANHIELHSSSAYTAQVSQLTDLFVGHVGK